MTNYENIKNMTIEEMAKIIECPNNIDANYDESNYCYVSDNDMCFKCCINYLNSVVG